MEIYTRSYFNALRPLDMYLLEQEKCYKQAVYIGLSWLIIIFYVVNVKFH